MKFHDYPTTVSKGNLSEMHYKSSKPIFSEWPTNHHPHINGSNFSIFEATDFIFISNCSEKSVDYESTNNSKSPKCDLRLVLS